VDAAVLGHTHVVQPEDEIIVGGVLLPCNVVVSAQNGGSKIQILDPLIMASVMGRDELQPIAQEAARRLQTVLDTLVAGD